jgi:EmrB/QacA subfamily drug resistance transporter
VPRHHTGRAAPVSRGTAPRYGCAVDTAEEQRSHTGFILAVACIAQFMVVLDVSVVNVALVTVGRDLHYTTSGLQWVVNAYVLTFAGFLLLGGRAADLFGQRRIFLLGLAIFTGASLLAGFATSDTLLTAARALQGFGGAILSPATLTIIVTTFQGPKLARAIGLWSAVAGAGGATGALLGGILVTELSWRWVFFINVPIGAALAFMAITYLPEHRRAKGRASLDVPGAVLVTLGLTAAVYGIVNTTTYAWGSSRTLVTLAIALVLLVGFFVAETRLVAVPLVPMRFFRSRTASGANIVMLLVGGAFFSMWYFLTLFMQQVLGYSALRTGLAFLPQSFAIIIGAQISSRIMSRTGTWPVVTAGTTFATVGFVLLSQLSPTSSYAAGIMLPGCIVAFALGLLFSPLAAAATSTVAPQDAGLASGILSTSRQVGGSLGLALLASIEISRATGLFGRPLPPVSSAAFHTAAARAAITSGFDAAFRWSAGVTAIALVAALLLRGARPTTQPAPSPTPAAVSVE